MIVDTYEHPIIVSVACYAFFLTAGSILRALIQKFIPHRYQVYGLYFVTTFSVLGCSFENGHVRSHYGYFAYFVLILFLQFWHTWTLLDSSANPIELVIGYCHRQQSLLQAISLVFVQVCGALLGFKTALFIWGLQLCHNHQTKFRSYPKCSADIIVSVPVAILVESLGTALGVFLDFTSFTNSRRLEFVVKSVVMCLLTTLLVDVSTGFYLNPMNASNQSLGCEGMSLFDHFLVYWAGPLVLTYIVVANLSTLQKLLPGRTRLHSD